ncbi:tripartite tricarboxylate transporter substrate binding protein [Bradyrhizobium lablabi]|uniref:Bug family tripartite tricarboxylate transporter substrate binding protein n=1 Tax=Bradyrhizobium lablabi TaxID=722472 RepID=UPI001BA98AA2|nr:tripartite tricarboxylate transporter substrate binding protein [Bradyrhizobium lablabi]MBR1123240.1 tripartite tricarboxylate transporter substrate binding protein [Bradyrhizobium lablabi]
MLHRGMRFLCLALFVLAGAPGSSAFAQAQHKGPIKVIIPFPAGDLVDIIARLLADDMAKDLGQPIVIDNRPGASGLIGLQAVASAEPDGHTLAMGQLGNMAITPVMNKWPLDVRTTLEPVALTYTNYVMILAAPNFKVNSLQELIAYSKANPGAIRVATVGTGSFPHLMFEMLRKQAGFDYTHIPYRGGVQIAPDLVTGRIEAGSLSFSNGLSYISDGRLRGLAMSGRARNPAAPDLPTISETVPGLEMLGWFGFFAPKGTPPAMINRINAAVNRAMANPETEKQAKNLYIDAAPGTPADFARLWKDDYDRLSSLIRELGIAQQ